MTKPEFKNYHEYHGNPGDLRWNPYNNYYEVFKNGGWLPLIPPTIEPYYHEPDTLGLLDKIGGNCYRWQDVVDVILLILMEQGLIEDMEDFKRKLNNKMNAKALADKLMEME